METVTVSSKGQIVLPAKIRKQFGLKKDGKLIICDNNPEAMAQRAFELLQDNALRERLSRNALAWAGEFGWDRSAEEFLKALEAIKNRHTSDARKVVIGE